MLYNYVIFSTRVLIYLFFFLYNASAVYSQSPIELKDDNQSLFVGQSCLIKPDFIQKNTIETISKEKNFEKNINEHIKIGVGERQQVWLKFQVLNTQEDNAFLELHYPLIDTAILYTHDGNSIIETQLSGQNFLPNQRYIEHNKIVFKIKKSDKPLTYYCNVKARWFCNIKPKIYTTKAFIEQKHFNDLIQGIFMGIVSIFIIYNLFVFIQLRSTVYFFYSLYLFSISFFVVRHNGYAGEFIFRYTPQYNDLTFVMTGLAGIFGTLFTTHFLDTKKYLPKLHHAFQGLMITYIIYTILLAANEMYFTVILSQILIPIGTVFVVIASTKLWYRGHTYAKYYFMGWLALFICQMAFIFENQGVINSNFISTYSLHIGIAFEATVLSYAIADRFRMIQLNESKVQVQLIEAMKEKELLIQDKNRNLEHKVSERTAELQNAMTQIMDSEYKLQDYAGRLEKSNKELSDFAYIASHDLKAPIRGIISFLQLFEKRSKSKFDNTDIEYFNFIKNNAFHSAQLIEDVLNYSRIDKNLGEAKEIDIRNTILMAEMNLNSLIKERNAQIICSNMPYVKGHSSLLVQLFQNLIVNGLKYNQSEKPIIQINVDMRTEDNIVFSVKDNGIGIAPEFHKTIFSMFRRLHSQSEYEGTGIGLAFCQRIVNTYGGQMWLESEEGKGSTFYFTIPKAFPYVGTQIPTLKIAS